MKTPTLIILLGLCLAGPLFTAGVVTAQTDAQSQKLSAADIDTLVGPIALYPDALVGIILPASTNPADIVLAARFLDGGGTQEQVDGQPWEQSVRSLAHYPDVLKWMDENLAWTQQLGVTFVLQPEDVMTAIQRLRERAQALGNLKTTEQLTIINEPGYIRIVPTHVERIYVPYYDANVIYVSPFTWWFGPAWICGSWLWYDCNWVSRSIWFGAWSPRYFHRPAWRLISGRQPPAHFVSRHTWRPDMKRWDARPHPAPRPGNITRPRQFGWDKQHNRTPANPRGAGAAVPSSSSNFGSKSGPQGVAPAVQNSNPASRGGDVENRRPATTNGNAGASGRVGQGQRGGDNPRRDANRPPPQNRGERVQRPHTPPPSTSARVSQSATSDSSGKNPQAAQSQQGGTSRGETTSGKSNGASASSSPGTRSGSSSSSDNNTSSSSGTTTSSSASSASSSNSGRSSSESRSSYQPPPRSESPRSAPPPSRGDSGSSSRGSSGGGGGRPRR